MVVVDVVIIVTRGMRWTPAAAASSSTVAARVVGVVVVSLMRVILG